MKVTKTTVYRLTVEKKCGCTGTQEYDDPKYQNALTEGSTTLCEKHNEKSEDAKEILHEGILEALEMQAEILGKQNQYAPMRQVVEGDSGGVLAPGAESVQTMGMNMRGPRRDPLEVSNLQTTRQAPKLKAASANPLANLNFAPSDEIIVEDGVEITGSIEEVPEDPRLSGFIESAIEGGGLEDIMDAEDEYIEKTGRMPRIK